MSGRLGFPEKYTWNAADVPPHVRLRNARREVTCASRTYEQKAKGSEPIRVIGPTPEALDLLESATKGARVLRTGPASYVVVG